MIPTRTRRGQASEYGILLSFVVLVLLAALYTLSLAVSAMWVGISAGFAVAGAG